VATGTGTKF